MHNESLQTHETKCGDLECTVSGIDTAGIGFLWDSICNDECRAFHSTQTSWDNVRQKVIVGLMHCSMHIVSESDTRFRSVLILTQGLFKMWDRAQSSVLLIWAINANQEQELNQENGVL